MCLTDSRYDATADSLTGSRIRTRSTANCQPWRAWQRQRAAGGDGLALANVPERADEHDRLAVVADAVEHREVAVGQAPADAHHLRGQLAGRGITRRGVLRAVGHRDQSGTPRLTATRSYVYIHAYDPSRRR